METPNREPQECIRNVVRNIPTSVLMFPSYSCPVWSPHEILLIFKGHLGLIQQLWSEIYEGQKHVISTIRSSVGFRGWGLGWVFPVVAKDPQEHSKRCGGPCNRSGVVQAGLWWGFLGQRDIARGTRGMRGGWFTCRGILRSALMGGPNVWQLTYEL